MKQIREFRFFKYVPDAEWEGPKAIRRQRKGVTSNLDQQTHQHILCIVRQNKNKNKNKNKLKY